MQLDAAEIEAIGLRLLALAARLRQRGVTFATWVEAEKGRAAAVALQLGVTRSAVSQWKVNGVPFDKMRAVVALSGGEVTLDDLVPAAEAVAPRAA